MAKTSFKDGFDIKKAMLSHVEDLKEKLPPFIKETVVDNLRKDGIVIGVSGGVDSALIATLAVEALGSDHVYGLILPEKESSSFQQGTGDAVMQETENSLWRGPDHPHAGIIRHL